MVKLNNFILLEMKEGDITLEKVDAIANAANRDL